MLLSKWESEKAGGLASWLEKGGEAGCRVMMWTGTWVARGVFELFELFRGKGPGWEAGEDGCKRQTRDLYL